MYQVNHGRRKYTYIYIKFTLWIRKFLSCINYKFKLADEKKVHLKNRLSMSDAIKINSFH